LCICPNSFNNFEMSSFSKKIWNEIRSFFRPFDFCILQTCMIIWVRCQPPLGLENFPLKIAYFSIFFSSGQKKSHRLRSKIPSSKMGQPLIYCGSKVWLGQVRANRTRKVSHGFGQKLHRCGKYRTTYKWQYADTWYEVFVNCGIYCD